MRAAGLVALGVLVLAVGAVRPADESSPHRMTQADGTLDTAKCAACHEEDLSLSRSKRETCTLCHAGPMHGGALEHLDVAPARVARLLALRTDAGTTLPLREDGGIYCGTCHLFHDPAMGEQFLPAPSLPASTGLSEAVRRGVRDQVEARARAQGEQGAARFLTTGTKALRLPVADASLCIHCHGGMR